MENYLKNSFCLLVDELKASLSNLVEKLLLCIGFVFLHLVGGSVPLVDQYEVSHLKAEEAQVNRVTWSAW